MKTTLEFCDHVLVVRLHGDLDHHLAQHVREQIDSAAATGSIRKIVFDFRQVSFMDSSGLGVLMGRHRLMEAVGGSVALFGVTPRMDKLLTMSGVKTIIAVYETQEQALEKGAAQ